MINIFEPDVSLDTIERLKGVFQSNWLGRGKISQEFEQELSLILAVDGQNLHTMGSCTEAIFHVLRACELTEADEVIVSDISFISIASAVQSVGAKMKLIDVDLNCVSPTYDQIVKSVTNKTRLVILTHYGGYCSELSKIARFCRDNDILLLEDAAGAFGSKYENKSLGTFGDFGVWSFDSMKTITTGEGGLIYCKDTVILEKIKEYAYLGLPSSSKSGMDSSYSKQTRWWEFQIKSFGRRSLFNDISAAIGLEQLQKFEVIKKRRNDIRDYYQAQFKDCVSCLNHSHMPNYFSAVSYLYWIESKNRDNLATCLYKNGIYTTYRYYPLSMQQIVQKVTPKTKLPVSKYISETFLNIPCHHKLNDTEVIYIAKQVRENLNV